MPFILYFILFFISLTAAKPIYKTFHVQGEEINRWVELEYIEDLDDNGKYIHAKGFSGQDSGYESWTKYYKNGEKRSLRTNNGTEFKFDQRGHIIYVKKFQSKDVPDYESFSEYDKNGNKTLYRSYKWDENKNRHFEWEWQYKYDSKGRKIFEGHKSNHTYSYFWEYDKNGAKIRESKITDGKVLEHAEWNSKGTLTNYFSTSYDDSVSYKINKHPLNDTIFSIFIGRGDTSITKSDIQGRLLFRKTNPRKICIDLAPCRHPYRGDWDKSCFLFHKEAFECSKHAIKGGELTLNYDIMGRLIHATFNGHEKWEEWWDYNKDSTKFGILHHYRKTDRNNSPEEIHDHGGFLLADSTFKYDQNNNLVYVRDNFSNDNYSLEYENGLVSHIKASYGFEIFAKYDSIGNLLKLEDSYGNIKNFNFKNVKNRANQFLYYIKDDNRTRSDGYKTMSLKNQEGKTTYEFILVPSLPQIKWISYDQKGREELSYEYHFNYLSPLHINLTKYDSTDHLLYEKKSCQSFTPSVKDCQYWTKYESGKKIFDSEFNKSDSTYTLTTFDKKGDTLSHKKCNDPHSPKEDCILWEKYKNGKLFYTYNFSKEENKIIFENYEQWWIQDKKNVQGKVLQMHFEGNPVFFYYNKKGDLEYEKDFNGSELFFEYIYKNNRLKKRIRYRSVGSAP